MCSEWFELVEQAKLSNERTEQLTVAAQAQFKVIYCTKNVCNKIVMVGGS